MANIRFRSAFLSLYPTKEYFWKKYTNIFELLLNKKFSVKLFLYNWFNYVNEP